MTLYDRQAPEVVAALLDGYKWARAPHVIWRPATRGGAASPESYRELPDRAFVCHDTRLVYRVWVDNGK